MLDKSGVSTYKVTLMSGIHKVNVPTADDYRKVMDQLKEGDFQYYTYEDKNTRPIKVMARGIDPTCTEQMIAEHLTERKLAIREVVNIKKRERKGDEVTLRSLPLFMLVFDKNEDISKIYSIEQILGLRVKIEPLRKRSSLIPQCKRCQRFGHTQKFCNNKPRCVKCAGQHLTNSCVKPKSKPAKCYNCGEAHPASYRGCMVAKMAQGQRDDARHIQKKKNTFRHPNVLNSNRQADNIQEPGNSNQKTKMKQLTLETAYARAVKGNKQDHEKVEQAKPDAVSQTLQEILKELKEQKEMNNIILARLTKLESSNKGAVPQKKK